LKGLQYSSSKAAIINAQGELDAASGDATDCVRVDGSPGPCGTPSPTFIDSEIPSGTVNGANATFTLSDIPNPPASLHVYRNGLLQRVSTDYTLNGNTITFEAGAIPRTGDTLLATFRMGGPGYLAGLTGPMPPQVLCAGTGSGSSSATLVTLGSCPIPPGTLQPGDRIEIRFDYAHQGVTTGFTFEVRWGMTTLLSRAAAAVETIVTGRSDAALHAGGAQYGTLSWGSALPFLPGIGNASDSIGSPLTIDFLGRMAAATSDSVILRNFTVVRYPSQTVP